MNRSGYVWQMFPLAAAAAAVLSVCLISGCGSDGPDNPFNIQSQAGLVSTDQQYQQKVYIIGEIKEPTQAESENITTRIAAVRGPAEAAKQVFVNRLPYDGTSSDAPIFIAADQVKSLGSTSKQGILATYRNSFPIILIRAGETEINTLLEILDRVPNYKLPHNYPYAELFAVSTELAGNFSLSIFPPGSSDPSSNPGSSATDDTGGLLARADALRTWISASGTRTMLKSTADFQANAVKASKELSKTELTELVKAEHDQVIFTQDEKYGANTYTFVYTMYPFHQFKDANGGSVSYDWLYVEQQGYLSAEPRYTKFGEVGGCSNGELSLFTSEPFISGSCTSSIDRYRITNEIPEITTGVTLERSSPATENKTTTTKSGIKWDLGGDFGLKGHAGASEKLGPDVSGDVSTTVKGGVSINNESTFVTSDCTTTEISKNNAPGWQYSFTRPTQYGWAVASARLNPPVELSRSTFQPVQKWIWRLTPDIREKKQNFKTKLKVDNLVTVAGISVFWTPVTGPYYSVESLSFEPLPFETSPALHYAPVIVAPAKNLNLDKKAQYKTMEVSVGRDWFASCDQDWCQAAPTTGKGDNPQFSVTTSENTTGKERKATITFKTYDYTGTTADNKYKLDRMYVTQAPL